MSKKENLLYNTNKKRKLFLIDQRRKDELDDNITVKIKIRKEGE